jgi:ADP-dependent NAD(P)H-hydrate dehydratase / NAD(P)H-hydrate epimerase
VPDFSLARAPFLEPLYTAEEMQAAEAGHDVPTLMERAGRAVAEEALRRFPDARSFGAVCGGGANGGDGRIALEFLRGAGRTAEEGTDGDVLIDALFGTGFKGEPRPEAAAQIEAMNGAGQPVVAVDLPSGVNADTGEVAGAAVRADVTVTMHGRKVGLEVAPGRFHAGEVVVADIGLEPLETEHRLVTPAILDLVPRKGERDNKYSAGAVLVVGGSPGMGGAVTLTATAAFRADAGYVTVCSDVEPQLLEAVKRPLDEVFDAVPRHGALAVGPGLGRGEERRALVRRLLQDTDLPAVVDADGLYGLEPFERSAPTVLTPHSGELGRLLGRESEWVDAHRLEAVRDASTRFGCVCLLKGADTLVAAPGSSLEAPLAEPSAPGQEPARLRRDGILACRLTHPSLATAGSGDVLTGVIGAFLAKGLEARLAAAAAAVACDRAAGLGSERGLVASDVAALLPGALGQDRADAAL